MSITRGVLARSPKPEAYDKVLGNNTDGIGIWFWRTTRRKTSRSKEENQQQTHNPHMTPSPGIEPGPHWWEASAGLTTAPSLLPWEYKRMCTC